MLPKVKKFLVRVVRTLRAPHLLIVNKIDLAPLVGADLGLNGSGYTKMRGLGPFVFSNLESGERVEPIANFII